MSPVVVPVTLASTGGCFIGDTAVEMVILICPPSFLYTGKSTVGLLKIKVHMSRYLTCRLIVIAAIASVKKQHAQ